MLRLCLATAKQSVIQAPSPLTRKADLRKKLMHKTKFSTLKVLVSVRQIWIQIYSNSVSSQIYGKRFARVFCRYCQKASRIYNRESKKR